MKIFIILFISTALMLCLNATIQINAQVDLQNGLVAFYPFNGNANDESGNNNNGSVHGAKLTTDRFGNPNSAYNFNGLDNYIVVANSTSLTSIENSNIVSISAWVLIRNWYQGWNIFAIINKYREFDDNGWEFLAGAMPSEGFGFGLELGMSKYYDYQFTFNTWYHLAAVYDKDQDMMNLYLNGQKVFTDTCNSSLKNTQGGPLFIGYSPMGPDEYSDGKIDDIRIYNRELSDTEIQTIYQEKPPDKLLYIKPATNISKSGFTANWYKYPGSKDFKLDFTNDPQFDSLILSNVDVGNDSSYTITGLSLIEGATYYYRMRAIAGRDTSPNSSPQSLLVSCNQGTNALYILKLKQPPIEQCIINGIKNTELGGMKVFPNPSNGNVTLSLDENQRGSPVIVQVLNLDGAVLLNYLDYADGNNSQLSLDLTKFLKGLYIIQDSGKGITHRDKIIIL